MIDAGQMMAYLDLDSKKFNAGIKGAISAVKDLTDKSLSASSKLKGLGSAMGQLGRDASTLSIGIAAIGTASVTAYAQLDTASRKVSTVADTAILSLQGIKEGTRELSNDLRTMPTDVSAGLYDMISANNDTANSLDYTRIAVKAAKGGFTETAIAVDGLTTVMNAYAMTGVDSMQRVSDQMLTAQNYGKTTFGAIAASIGNVIPLTAQLKTGTDELFASLAVLTKQGIGTSEAVTGLKAVYAGILKPTAEATKAAKEMGLDFSASALRAKGLGGFLDELVAKTGGSADKITELFGSVEALNTVLAMTSEAGRKDFAGAMEAMRNSAGATDAAYQTMVSGIEGAFDHVKVAVVNLGSVAAEDAAPKLEELANWVAEITEGFQDLPPEIRSTIVTVTGLAAALGPVLIVGGKLVAAFGQLAAFFSGPAGWVTLGIAGVSAIAYGLNELNKSVDYTHLAATELQEAIDPEAITRYREAAASVGIALDVDVSSNAGENVTSAVDKLRGILNSIDVLTDEQRDQIVAMIGTDINPIKSALAAAGLTEGQAEAVQGEIDAALRTLREKLMAMNIVDEGTLSKITQLVSQDRAQLKGSLLALGLTPSQADNVAAEVISAQDTIREKLTSLNILSETEIRQIMKMVGQDKAQLIGSLKAMGLTEAEATAVANAINASTATITSGVYSLYNKIYQALTDGKPDTTEQSTALQTEVQTYYDDLVGKINLDTETKIANLKSQLESGFITYEQYQTRADAITKQNGELVTSVQQTCTDTLTFVADMSGKSTEEVQKALTKIEELKAKALEEAAAIEFLTQEANSEKGKNAQFQVKAGAKVDQETVDVAFSTAQSQHAVDIYGAEQTSKAEQDRINQEYQASYEGAVKDRASPEELQKVTDHRNALIEAEKAKLEEQKKRFNDAYQQTIQELTAGILKTQPELSQQLQTAFDGFDISEQLSQLVKKLGSGEIKPADIEWSDKLAKAVFGVDKASDITQQMMQKLIGAGFGTPDAGTSLAIELDKIGTGLAKQANDTLTNMGGLKGTLPAKMLQSMLDTGGLTDVGFFNPDNTRDWLSLMIGGMDLAGMTKDEINKELEDIPPGKAPVPVEAEPEVKVDGSPETVKGAAEEALTPKEGETPVEVTVPVEAKPEVSAEGGTAGAKPPEDLITPLIDKIKQGFVGRADVPEEIANALGLSGDMLYQSIVAQLAFGQQGELVKFFEDLRNQMYTDAQTAGQAAPQGVADGVTNNQTLAATAVLGLVAAAGGPLGTLAASGLSSGVSAIQGLISGAESMRDKLIAKFTSLASAAIEAAHKKLEINSPSKVFARIGAGTVEGFVKGVDDNYTLAQKSMNRMTSLSAIGPSQITGAGRAPQTNTVSKTYHTTSRTYNFPGDIHVNDDAQMLEFERRIQRIDRDLSYGVGG